MESLPGVQHEPNAIIVTGPSINEAHARVLQAAATLTVDGRPAANAIDNVIGGG